MTNPTPHAAAVLLDAGSLAAELGGGRPLLLLDVRWAAGVVQRADYLAGHLPGAVFLDLDADLAAPPGRGGRHPLPEPLALERVWRRAGIDDDSAVVVYDARDASVAARAWWLLRWSGLTDVRVLDGGFAAWAADPGRPVEQGAPPPRRAGRMTVRPGGMPVVDTTAAAALAGGTGTLLDARAAARYRGETEPLDPVAGHIPGARNLPLTDLLTPQGTFRSAVELQDLLDRAIRDDGPVGTEPGAGGLVGGEPGAGGLVGGEPGAGGLVGGEPGAGGLVRGGQLAASCGSGVTACHLILAGAAVGRTIALYPDSYSGWLAQGLPVAVGPAPGGPVDAGRLT